MRQLRTRIHRVIAHVNRINPGRVASSYAEHRAIAEAVIRGDAAARLIEEHLEYGTFHRLSPRRR